MGRRLECAVDVVRTDTASGGPGDTSEVSVVVNGENLGTQTLGGDRDDSFDITRLLADEGFFGSSGCTLFHIQLRRPGYTFRMFIDEGSGTSLSSEAGDTSNVSATIPGAIFTDWAWVT